LWVTFLLLGASVPAIHPATQKPRVSGAPAIHPITQKPRVSGAPGMAQQGCGANSPERVDAMEQAIEQAKSCTAAAAVWRKCPFGASGDLALTASIIDKCEKSFLNQLPPAGKKRYDEEMQLCNYQYSQQEGTLWMSKAAGCQVDVAEHFAANPVLATRPASRASFDCEQARSVLEKAICSDIRLGHADIVLSRVFREALNRNRKNRLALLEDDNKWRQSLQAKCGLASSLSLSLALREDSLNCVRKEFEDRFTAFNWCLEGIEGNDCSPSRGDNRPQD
jgi:uncharacterized protein